MLFLVLLMSTVFSVKGQFTEISGLSKAQKRQPVKLFKVVSGRMEELASVRPADNGRFHIKFQPGYEGLYAIGFGDAKEIQNKFKLYVKGNEKINIELNDSTYVLNGLNTKENEVLMAWQKLAFKIERRSVYFMPRVLHGFFPQLDDLLFKSRNWTKGKETGNATFDRFMKTIVDYDIACFALAFVSSLRASQPNPDTYNAYLKNFPADRFLGNTELLKLPYGTIMLRNLVSFKNRGVPASEVDRRVMSIPNDTLKGVYVIDEAAKQRSYAAFQAITDKYRAYFLTTDQRTQIMKYDSALKVFKTGQEAINFSYPDVSGKIVSLSDFKGKLVLVDVWATWCGPCIKEIPYLKALEKAFHDKDVAFLSVSVDQQKDLEKWKKFIADEQLGGIQLFAGGGNTVISTAYKITGIPRFMLFDKKGNIIEVDSPRPSDPKLKEILNKYVGEE